MSAALTEAALVDHFRAAATSDDRIGVEIELLAVDSEDGRPARAHAIERAVRAAPDAMSFEAPGQVEVRTPPVRSLAELAAAIARAVGRASEQLGRERVLALGLGFQPFAPLVDAGAEPPVVASDEAMVLHRSAAVHVSLSYRDERDAWAKMRGARALAAPLVALFGGSPLAHGHAAGASVRSAFWASAFATRQVPDELLGEPDGCFARYAAWAAALPAERTPSGRAMTFRDWLDGGDVPAPRAADWEAHLRMPTRDVRLKTVVELRYFDSLPVAGAIAAAAVVRGLLGDGDNLAWAAARAEPAAAREERLRAASRAGLADAAVAAELDELVARAAAGLARQGDDDAPL